MRKLTTAELNRPDIEDFKQLEKLPVTVVLDNVRSMHNIGSIFRTCDGFAVERICLCGITAQPPHRDIEKTALGATNSIEWSYYPTTSDALSELKSQDYSIVAVEQAEGSTLLHEFSPSATKKYALILGNEVDGVSIEGMELSDSCIEIPQFGTKHSFNVVISAGIVLWDFYAKLRLGRS
ncbi:MAG: TrmH family RNA methyltransferase [Sphingobacteriales bacterium]|nr:MAG: TrmH family RNA methyltransferase [Sphingobacteriales bacterium]